MDTSTPFQNQLLATKFYVPVAPGALIVRPRLKEMLSKNLLRPLTLISAPAGFGKTTLLASWAQSLLARKILVAWVSLDEEDNEPRQFWTYILTALNKQQPERFLPLLMQLQLPQLPPLNYILTMLINLLAEGTEEFILILDDYQTIIEQQVHTTLTYLMEHLSTQLHIIISTRSDPPLSLSQLRARGQILEVRTDQLRCTIEETRAFFDKVMDMQLPDEVIQDVVTRTEGWLVGLHLLGLSLPKQTDPLSLLQEISGDQRYILDYLTQEVLAQQPQEVQTFLLCTSILEQLSASLCDAVIEQSGSQQVLRRLEQANLFVVSLDSRRQWYRYHALFAEALRYQLEHRHTDLVPILHRRASLWYAEHDQTTLAILHALHAKEWNWVADLIERKSLLLLALSWGASQHTLTTLRQWMKQLPADIVGSRPRFCLSCALMLWTVAPHTLIEAWLDVAETTLTTSTPEAVPSTTHALQTQQEQQDLLGEVIGFRAMLRSYQEDGYVALSLCEQALALLRPDNMIARAQIVHAQHVAYGISSANNVMTSIETALQAGLLARETGQAPLAIGLIGSAAQTMLLAGQLHKAFQLSKEAIQLSKESGGVVLPDIGYPALFQAEVLCEWNQLDKALSLAEEAVKLCQQTTSLASLAYLINGYAILAHVYLVCGKLDEAHSALQEFERCGMSMSQPLYLHLRSVDVTVDQVRLWLACRELDQAKRWAEELDLRERHSTPFAYEREEVARARILLATAQPTLVLERLEFVLKRATTGQRWGHVIEIRLLQALAYQMCQQEVQALYVLSEAIHLAEPEGYIRSFVSEGASMEALLYDLRKRERQHRPMPYLDTLLAAFQQQRMVQIQTTESIKAQILPDPLSEREMRVLQILARGASNLEIAQELVIATNTVKRHVHHIFSKLGVQSRFHAVMQARQLGLLNEDS